MTIVPRATFATSRRSILAGGASLVLAGAVGFSASSAPARPPRGPGRTGEGRVETKGGGAAFCKERFNADLLAFVKS